MVERKKHLAHLTVPEYFLEDLPIYEIKKQTGKPKVAKLSYNESPYGASPAVGAALRHIYETEITRYGDPYQVELVEEISKYTGYPKEMIVFGNGADELIDLVCRAFVGSEEEVLLPLPTFGTYLMDPKLSGAQVRTIPPTEDLQIDLEEIIHQITPQTKIIALCNPNNPSGRLIPSKEITEWLRKIPSHILVVVDEAYAEYVDSPDYYPAWQDLEEFSNLIVIRTFSKIFGLASLRLGYGIASPQITEGIEICRKIANVNSFAAAAGIAALKDQEFVREVKEKNQKERERLSVALTELGYTVIPSQTNFVMVRFGAKAKALWKYLTDQGIWTRVGWNLPEYIRISLGSPEENDWLIAEVKKWKVQEENNQ